MGLKILHSADWHLDSPFASFPSPQRQQLKAAQLTLPDQIAELCIRENCDLVLLAGDLLDGKASRETLDRLKRAFARCGVPVLISPGNHDFCGPGSPWLEESWPENVHVFTGGLSCVVLKELDCRVWGAGFRSMDCESLLAHFRAEGPETYHLGLFHGDPLQANSPCNPVTAAQVRQSRLRYLALGHIHKAGAFRSGNTLCGWPGCPMGRGWDETGEKGVYIVQVEAENVSLEQRRVNVPRFYDLTADSADALQNLLPPVPGADHYRVTLTGEGTQDIRDLKAAFAHFPNLVLVDCREAPLDIWGHEGEDTMEGTYFRLLREKLTGADPETARCVLLAAEISRRLLEGREVTLA